MFKSIVFVSFIFCIGNKPSTCEVILWIIKGPLLYSTNNFVEHSDIKRTTTPNIFKNKVKKVVLDCQGEGETI